MQTASPRTSENLRERWTRLPSHSWETAFPIQIGRPKDYAALKAHHYKAATPASITRVLTILDDGPDVGERFRQQPPARRPIAVLVESLGCLSCRLRDEALEARYGNHLPPKQRAILLNAELRCISRVVVDPRYRGLGLAVRLVRHALQHPTTIYTEALAAMGRVHPFFAKAGMQAYTRPIHEIDDRLIAALARAGLSVEDLSNNDDAWAKVQSLPQAMRRWVLRELHSWHRRWAGRCRVHETDPRRHLALARDRLRFRPVYYLHDNRAALSGAPTHDP